MARQNVHIPLVYSCSGCSSAAQLTNTLALRLARDGEAHGWLPWRGTDGGRAAGRRRRPVTPAAPDEAYGRST